MKNPFMYGQIVTGDAFTCRKREQNIIKDNIKNSHSCWLYSKRRAGKTSLVKKVIEDNPEMGIVYIDLFLPFNKKDFIIKYAKALTNKLLLSTTLEDSIHNVKKYFKVVKSDISMNDDSNFLVNFTINDADIESSLEEVINIPQKYAENNKSKAIGIVLDEFQSINNIDNNLLSQLRAMYQQHPRVSYVFLGSKKNDIEGIFSSEDSPFYNFASRVEIEPIKDEEWRLYITKKFEESGLTIPTRVINNILETSNGQPFYTQYFAATVWNLMKRNEDLTRDPWLFAKELTAQHESFFRELMEGLSRNQFKTVLIIANNNGENIYASTGLKKFDISKSSAERCVESLINTNIVYKEGSKYIFSNPILKYWILKNFQ